MMKKIDFDDYANDYDKIMREQLNFFDDSLDYIAEYKIKMARGFFSAPPSDILDFGCGVGRSMPFFQKYFPTASLQGCDLSEKSLLMAKEKFPQVFFCKTDELTTRTRQFDLIFLSGVMHHIKVDERKATLALLKSLLKKDGKIIIFEHNPLNPVTRKLVRECPFDEDAVLLRARELKSLLLEVGVNKAQSYYTLFFPAMLKFLRPLERYLRFLPLGGQYVVCGSVG